MRHGNSGRKLNRNSSHRSAMWANMVTALSMARAGLGITVLPLISLNAMRMTGLRYAKLGEPRPLRTIGIIARADRQLSAAASAFIRCLVQEKPAAVA